MDSSLLHFIFIWTLFCHIRLCSSLVRPMQQGCCSAAPLPLSDSRTMVKLAVRNWRNSCFHLLIYSLCQQTLNQALINLILRSCHRKRKLKMQLWHVIITPQCQVMMVIALQNLHKPTQIQRDLCPFYLLRRIVWHRIAWQLKVMMSMGHSGLWDLASGGSQRLFKARTKRPLNLIEVASGHNNNDRSYR